MNPGRAAPNGRYSGSGIDRTMSGSFAVDRALRKNADAAGRGYDLDAEAIARDRRRLRDLLF